MFVYLKYLRIQRLLVFFTFLCHVSIFGVYAGTPLPSDQYNFMMAVRNCLTEAPADGLCTTYGQTSGYGLMPDWDTSQVTDMSSSFGRQSQFNGDITLWDTSNVTSMRSMFLNSGMSLYMLDTRANFVLATLWTNPGFIVAREARKFSDVTEDGAWRGW